MYRVEWSERAKANLAKIDPVKVRKIEKKVETYLVKNPKQLGKPMTGKYKGLYRCKFSEYRVIYEIKENKLLILVVKVGNRKEVY